MKTSKNFTVRIYSQVDADLIEMAIVKSGSAQADWVRNALLLTAEVQILKGGIPGLALKNTLLLRRLLQANGNFSNAQISEAMEWSTTEFGKIFNLKEVKQS